MTVLTHDCQFLLGLYLKNAGSGLTIKEIAAGSKRFFDGRNPNSKAWHMTALSLRGQLLIEAVGLPAQSSGDGRGRPPQLYRLTQTGAEEARRAIQLFAEVILESTKLPSS